MATIVNKSEFTISVNAEGADVFTIRPNEQDGRLSDVQAKEWAGRKSNKLITSGLVLVRYDSNDPKKRAKTEPETTVVSDHEDLATMHWSDSVAAVELCEDLDVLVDLHENETRPRVREAIETRMKELRNG